MKSRNPYARKIARKAGASCRIRTDDLLITSQSIDLVIFVTKSIYASRSSGPLRWRIISSNGREHDGMIAESPMVLRTLYDWWLSDAEARGLAAKTLSFYRQRLAPVLADFGQTDPNDLNVLILRQWLKEQQTARGWTATTVNHTITALKVLLNFAFDEEMLDKNPLARLKKINAPQRLPAPYSDDEVQRLLQACGGNYNGLRDKTILVVLLDTGLRMGEAAALQLADVDLTAMRLHVRHGKGDKARVVPFSAVTRRMLLKWLSRRTADAREPALWTTSVGTPMTANALDLAHTRIAMRAGVPGATLHRWRHTFATRWLQAGGSLTLLQAILGHATSFMTLRYGHVAGLDTAADHRHASPATQLLGARWRG